MTDRQLYRLAKRSGAVYTEMDGHSVLFVFDGSLKEWNGLEDYNEHTKVATYKLTKGCPFSLRDTLLPITFVHVFKKDGK